MERLYQDREVSVRLRGLDGPAGVRIHLEHQSGAALIVPACARESSEGAAVFRLTGFDGVQFTVTVDPVGDHLWLRTSGPSLLLGGQRERKVPRGPDPEPQNRGICVTGDESTMPIPVDE